MPRTGTMMTAQQRARYYKADGKEGTQRALPVDPFDGVVNEAAIHAVVTAQLANRRQGTAAAKNRSAVRGGGRKPWRQKGTGRARVGTIRSPIWRGGGVAFPPQPRPYRQDLPRKVQRLGRRSAFNAQAAQGRVLVLEDLEFERPQTRKLAKLLDRLGLGEQKVLILTAGHEPTVYLSARNLPNVEVRAYSNESAYDVLWADTVVIAERALAGSGATALEKTLSEGSDA